MLHKESLSEYITIRERIRAIAKSSSERAKVEDLVQLAIEHGTRDLKVTKKELHNILETVNRKYIKDFLFKYQKFGMLELESETHNEYHILLTSKLLGGDDVLPSQQLKLVYRKPGNSEIETMTSKDTIQTYNAAISELLSEITDLNNLKQLSSSASYRDSIRERVIKLKKKIKGYELRNKVELSAETSNLNAIIKIIIAQTKKEVENRGRRSELPMNPKNFVKYFYYKLSGRLKKPTDATDISWPAETKAAKEIISRHTDKNEEFFKNFIDWVLATHSDKVTLFFLKFKIQDYVQVLADQDIWRQNYASFLTKNGKPENEEELTCYFIKLYEASHGVYRPQATFARDMQDICRIHGYLGSHIDKTALFVRWGMEVALPKLKEKPCRPSGLLKLISEFESNYTAMLKETSSLDYDTEKAVKMSQTLIKRAFKRQDMKFEGAERQLLLKNLAKTSLTDLDEEAQSIVRNNPDTFELSELAIGLR